MNNPMIYPVINKKQYNFLKESLEQYLTSKYINKFDRQPDNLDFMSKESVDYLIYILGIKISEKEK